VTKYPVVFLFLGLHYSHIRFTTALNDHQAQYDVIISSLLIEKKILEQTTEAMV